MFAHLLLSTSTPLENLSLVEFVIVIVFTVYWSNVVAMLTSIGIRAGYHPLRKTAIAPIWPLTFVSPRLAQWGKYDPDNPPECVKGYIKMVDERVDKDA